MLLRWFTVITFMAGLSKSQGAAMDKDTLRVTPTSEVKGHPEVLLTLKCGDGTKAGVVQYWHTPFGRLQSPSFQSKLEPVFVHLDGSLVIPNSSFLHSGLYYCLLQHTEGAALWQYELHIDHNHQDKQTHDDYGQSSIRASIRFSRDIRSEEEQTHVADEVFAGAVAASVLLPFVFGFSFGALSRTHVLRFLGIVSKRLQLSHQQTDMADSGCTMTTLPPTSQSFDKGNLTDEDSVNCMHTMATASSPPIKPQRSFRHKKEVHQETAAYLERCTYEEKEERKTEEEEAGRSVDEKKKHCEEEEREGEGNETDKSRGGTEEKGGALSREDKECRQQDGGEETVKENRSKKVEGCEEEKRKTDDRERQDGGWKDNGEKAKAAEDSQQSSTESQDNDSGGRRHEDCMKNSTTAGEEASSLPCPARRSRVIRLYQYDEDGQRYCHLPDPTASDPGIIPRPRQRSCSLTRLNAIMAAASAGPLDREERDRTHFCMDI